VTSAASVSKVTATVISSGAGVLKISTRTKTLAAAPSPTAKGMQGRLNVWPPSASVAPRKVSVRPWAAAGTDDDRVAYCAILDSVPSVESCSTSLGETSGSESILASPPLVPDLRIAAELSPMTEAPEAEAADQEAPVETEAHVAMPKGLLSCFS
jgi:hypothetical protein